MEANKRAQQQAQAAADKEREATAVAREQDEVEKKKMDEKLGGKLKEAKKWALNMAMAWCIYLNLILTTTLYACDACFLL